MELIHLVWLYLILWTSTLNVCWLINLPANLNLLVGRAGIWLLAVIGLLGLGVWFDRLTYLKPHEAYYSWEFYSTHLIASALLSVPGFFYFRSRQ